MRENQEAESLACRYNGKRRQSFKLTLGMPDGRACVGDKIRNLFGYRFKYVVVYITAVVQQLAT